MKYYEDSEKKGVNPLIIILIPVLIVAGVVAVIVWALLGSGDEKPGDLAETTQIATEALRPTDAPINFATEVAEVPTETEEITTEELTTEQPTTEEALTEEDTTAEATAEETTAEETTAEETTVEEMPTYPEGVVAINETNFPDKEFRAVVQRRLDTNGDGGLDEEEIRSATVISMPGRYVYDVTGIEYLTYLEEFNCRGSYVRSMDLSKNTALRILDCGELEITELDLSSNTALTYVDCSWSKLKRLNVNGCAALESLYCNVTSIEQLDISGCVSLKNLYCGEAKLTSLDLSTNTALLELSCYNNQLGVLDVSHNPALQRIDCSNCSLSALDVSHNTRLQMLNLGTYLDYWTHTPDGPEESQNKVSQLDVSMLPELLYLDCTGNPVKSLDLRNNTELQELYCVGCGLNALDLSQNKKLDTLECSRNDLDKLVLKGYPKLYRLWCIGDKLTTLDVSGCPNLEYLECTENALTTLDLSHNMNLDSMYLSCDPGVAVSRTGVEPSEVEPSEEETFPPETLYGEETVVLENIPGTIDEATNIFHMKDNTYHWQAEEKDYFVSEGRRAEIEEEYLVLFGYFSLTTYPVPGRAQKEVVYIDREVTKIPLAQQVKYTFNGFASDLETINAVLLDDAGRRKTLYFSVVDGVVTDIGSYMGN